MDSGVCCKFRVECLYCYVIVSGLFNKQGDGIFNHWWSVCVNTVLFGTLRHESVSSTLQHGHAPSVTLAEQQSVWGPGGPSPLFSLFFKSTLAMLSPVCLHISFRVSSSILMKTLLRFRLRSYCQFETDTFLKKRSLQFTNMTYPSICLYQLLSIMANGFQDRSS